MDLSQRWSAYFHLHFKAMHSHHQAVVMKFEIQAVVVSVLKLNIMIVMDFVILQALQLVVAKYKLLIAVLVLNL